MVTIKKDMPLLATVEPAPLAERRGISPKTLLYYAGFFEVRGGIHLLTRESGNISPRIVVDDSNITLIKGLAETFGGTAYEVNAGSMRWQRTGADATEVIRALRPFAPSLAKFDDDYLAQLEGGESPTQVYQKYRAARENKRRHTAISEGLNAADYKDVLQEESFLRGLFSGRAFIRLDELGYELSVTTPNAALVEALCVEHKGHAFHNSRGDGWQIAGHELYSLLHTMQGPFEKPEIQEIKEAGERKMRTLLDIVAMHPQGITISDLMELINRVDPSKRISSIKLIDELSAAGRLIRTTRRTGITYVKLALVAENIEYIGHSPVALARFLNKLLWEENGGVVLSQAGEIAAFGIQREPRKMLHWNPRFNGSDNPLKRGVTIALQKGNYQLIEVDGTKVAGIFHLIDPGETATQYVQHNARALIEIPDALRTAFETAHERYTYYAAQLKDLSLIPFSPEEMAHWLFTNAVPPQFVA